MHITKEMYWLAFAIIILATACQPKRNEAWLLENQGAINNIIQPEGLSFYTNSVLDTRLKALQKLNKDFSKVNYENLSDTTKIIFLDLKHRIEFELYSQDTLNVFNWDATIYRITPHIRALVEAKELEKIRYTKVNEVLTLSDSFYQVAKENITDAISIENGKLAVDQHAADFLYLQNDLTKQIGESTIPDDLKSEINDNLENTMLNIKDYIGYVTSMVNNTDDLDDTTKVIEDNRRVVSTRKYLGKPLENFDFIQNIKTVELSNNAEILEREDYYLTIDEINELVANGDTTILNLLILLVQHELNIESDELAIPFQKLIDAQTQNMLTYPYRYAAQLQNYLWYQEYKENLKKQNKNDKLAALDSYIGKFKHIPFIFIKKVLEE